MQKHNWRLTSVINCGTVNWERRVMLSFQLADIDVEPKDKSLPIYKQFAKTPYGWVMSLNSSTFSDICTWLWCDKSLEWIISCVWMYVVVDIEVSQYQWKDMYNVMFVAKYLWDVWISDWWVETKSFIITNETTLEDINALWFDSKHLRQSDEYCILRQNIIDSDDILF